MPLQAGDECSPNRDNPSLSQPTTHASTGQDAKSEHSVASERAKGSSVAANGDADRCGVCNCVHRRGGTLTQRAYTVNVTHC